jgi:hypothetical protein
MTSWKAFEAEEPEFAERVRKRFTARKHGTLATLRKDGSPRISGTEVEFRDGELWLGSMPGARKALDLRRDPRLAVHSPTEDPPEGDDASWTGEAKLAGRAHEVVDPASTDGAHRFRIDLTEVVFTRLDQAAEHLVVEAWHPGRGLQRHVRR